MKIWNSTVQFARAFGVSATLITAGSAYAADANDSIQAYLKNADLVSSEIDAAAPNTTLIADTITQMLEQAKPVLLAFGDKRPDCREQLAKLLELYPEINAWSPQEIRKHIEGGDALPPAQGCYAARDIVAHPAIVRALVRAGIDGSQTNRLHREMNEAIEHGNEIAEELKQ